MPHVIMIPKDGVIGNQPEFLIMDTDDKKKMAVDFRMDYLEKQCSNLSQLFWSINKPDRLTLLSLLTGIYSFNGEYEDILRDAWVSTEFPHQMPIKRLTALFEQADLDKMMDDTEKAKLLALPDEITIYRGLPDQRAKKKGLSWSVNRNKAMWFATRWNSKKARLVTAKINKKNVYMYTDARKEEEVVVNPARLKIIETTQGITL